MCPVQTRIPQANIDRAGLVVAYCPAHEDGFVFVPATWRSGPNEDIPICVPRLPLDEIDWIRDHGL